MTGSILQVLYSFASKKNDGEHLPSSIFICLDDKWRGASSKFYIHLFWWQMTGSNFQVLYSYVWATNDGGGGARPNSTFISLDGKWWEASSKFYIHLFGRQMMGSIFQVLYSFVWTTNDGEHLPSSIFIFLDDKWRVTYSKFYTNFFLDDKWRGASSMFYIHFLGRQMMGCLFQVLHSFVLYSTTTTVSTPMNTNVCIPMTTNVCPSMNVLQWLPTYVLEWQQTYVP